jgi:hypothetical protein
MGPLLELTTPLVTWNFAQFTILFLYLISYYVLGVQVEVPMATNVIPISNCVHATDPLYYNSPSNI